MKKLEELLDALEQRAPWLPVGRPLLIRAGFSIRRGYEKTFSAALSEKSNPERTAKLEQALTEYSVVGEKVIQLIRVTSEERETVSEWIEGKRTSASSLSAPFPALAEAKVVRANVSSDPASLGRVDLIVGAAALYTSARSYLDRVELSPSNLKSGTLDDIERLVAVRRVHRQTFDAAWIPGRANVVCLVADQPQEAPCGFGELSLTALRAQLRHVLGRSVEPLNLWPAVSGLYKTADGRLVDYGFATDNESVKHHKARRGAKCLRQAVYDKAGADAVGDDLSPFRVAMQWTIDRADEGRPTPELLLPGVSSLLQKANPRLDQAVVRHCLDSRDLGFVVSKLLPHIK